MPDETPKKGLHVYIHQATMHVYIHPATMHVYIHPASKQDLIAGN